MTHRISASTGAAVVALFLVAGCASPDEFDGVLWQQMDAQKQPVFAAFDATLELDRTTLLDDIVSDGGVFPGSYRDDDAGALDLEARSGGVFLSRLVDGPDWASLDVLINSGPRNEAGDPLPGAEPYDGPPSVYTCFQAVVEFADDRVSAWVWDEDAECDPAVVAGLDDRAQFAPLYRFSG